MSFIAISEILQNYGCYLIKTLFGKTLVIVKDKTIDEGKRVQHLYQSILMVKPNGKNPWKDIKRFLQ